MLLFGAFALDESRLVLTKAGRDVPLAPKCAQLLAAFLRNPGRPLSKREIIDYVWRDAAASDATLAQHVWLLRRILRGESGIAIKTIARVGYVFRGSVNEIQPPRHDAGSAFQRSAAHLSAIGTERALSGAIDLYGRAITVNPTDAGLYAARAACFRRMALELHREPAPAFTSAANDSQAALALAPRHTRARIEAALALALSERNARAAYSHLDVAERAGATTAVSHIRMWIALIDGDADAAVDRSRSCSAETHGAALYFARRYAEAVTQLNGASGTLATLFRGASRLMLGDPAAALREAEALSECGAGKPAMRQYGLGLLIVAKSALGDRTRARQEAADLASLAAFRYVSPMLRAIAHLSLGETAIALDCLADAVRRRDPWASFLAVDPMLDPLRKLPRFASLLFGRAA